MKKTFFDNETELDQRLQCVEGLLRPLEDGQWLLSQLSPLKPLREDDRQRKRGGRARRTTAVWDKWASVDKPEKGMFMWSCSRTSDKSSHIHKPL